MKLVIFSICLNEEETVKELINRIPKKIKGINEIVFFILDDGSSDNTAKIATDNGIEVFSNGTQKRLAFSFQKAIDIALKKGGDIAVNIDGDLQYSPEEIPLLVKPIVDGRAEFAAATRFVGEKGEYRGRPENMPKANYYGNRLGTWIVSKLSKQHFSDVTSGFRAYSREAMLQININSKYTYTQETFQVLASKKLNIIQVPVSIKYFTGRKSRVVKSVATFISGSALNIIRSFRDFAPMLFFFWFGFINFLFGSILSTFTLVHYIQTQSFSPYKSVGFAALFFLSLAIFVWVFGLMADMLDRVLNNQEKIILHLKEQKYEKK